MTYTPKSNLFRNAFYQHETLVAANEAEKVAKASAVELQKLGLEKQKFYRDSIEKIGVRISQAEETLRPRDPQGIQQQLARLDAEISQLSAASAVPTVVAGMADTEATNKQIAQIDAARAEAGGNVPGIAKGLKGQTFTSEAMQYLRSQGVTEAQITGFGISTSTSKTSVAAVSSSPSRIALAEKKKARDALAEQYANLDPYGIEGGANGSKVRSELLADTKTFALAQQKLGLGNAAEVADFAAKMLADPEAVKKLLDESAISSEDKAQVEAELKQAYMRVANSKAYSRQDRKFYDPQYLSLINEQNALKRQEALLSEQLKKQLSPAEAGYRARDLAKFGVTRDDPDFYYLQEGRNDIYDAFKVARANLAKTEATRSSSRAQMIVNDYLAEAGPKATYEGAKRRLISRGVVGREDIRLGLSVIAERDVRMAEGIPAGPIKATTLEEKRAMRDKEIAVTRAQLAELSKKRIIGNVLEEFYNGAVTVEMAARKLKDARIHNAEQLSGAWKELRNTRPLNATVDSPPVTGNTPLQLRRNLVEYGVNAKDATERARAIDALQQTGISYERATRMIRRHDPLVSRENLMNAQRTKAHEALINTAERETLVENAPTILATPIEPDPVKTDIAPVQSEEDTMIPRIEPTPPVAETPVIEQPPEEMVTTLPGAKIDTSEQPPITRKAAPARNKATAPKVKSPELSVTIDSPLAPPPNNSAKAAQIKAFIANGQIKRGTPQYAAALDELDALEEK